MGIRRTRVGRAAALAVVLAVGAGILAMHVLSLSSGASPMHASPTPSGLSHASASHGPVRIDVGDSEMPAHGHDLAGCIWMLLVGGVAFLAALIGLRVRWRDDTRRCLRVLSDAFATTQRAPPVAVRLSLVGISRR